MDMTFLSDPALQPMDPDEEQEVFRRIEAGVLALAVLDGAHPWPVGATRDELQQLADEGSAARSRAVLGNLRLVARLATDTSRRTGVGAEELFQEGSLALAEAVRRFDHRRGTRFSTVCYPWIAGAVGRCAAQRGGQLEQPVWRIREGRRLELLRDRLSAVTGRPVDDAELARQQGRSTEWVREVLGATRGSSPVVPETLVSESASRDLAACEEVPPAWLDALEPVESRVLRWRHGVDDGVERDYAWCAARLGLSASSVRRIERRALAHARRLLDQPTAA